MVYNEEEAISLDKTIEKKELISSPTPTQRKFDHGNFKIVFTGNKVSFL